MRPSFQFYPGDWQRDTALRSVSVAARGLWIEMICIMHQSEPYGHLLINGKPMPKSTLARLVGASAAEITRWLKELEDAGVFDVEDGIIVSRRMVKDERTRLARAEGGKAGKSYGYLGAEHGAKGGRPASASPREGAKTTHQETPLHTPQGTGVIKPPSEPPPSSSSSSSSSSSRAASRAGARLLQLFPPSAGVWLPPHDWRVWAETERPDLDIDRVAAEFAAYWDSRAGPEGEKADEEAWRRAWEKWVRNERGAGKRRVVERDPFAGAI